jgi:hypothetical protein
MLTAIYCIFPLMIDFIVNYRHFILIHHQINNCKKNTNYYLLELIN